MQILVIIYLSEKNTLFMKEHPVIYMFSQLTALRRDNVEL